MTHVPIHFVSMGLERRTGYSLRTQAIVRAQKRLGFDPRVVVGPRRLYRLDGDNIRCADEDGVPYYYLPSWERFEERLRPHMGDATVVHAHTPYQSAVYARTYGRAVGLPVVHEVRGFWELSVAAEGGSAIGGFSLAQWRAGDSTLNRQADLVMTLSGTMRDELIRRGVEPDRIRVTGQGVDCDVFTPCAGKDPALLRDVRLQDRFVLGYATNVRQLEGIGVLLEALERLLTRGIPAAVLLLGDGTALPALQAKTQDLGIADQCRFVGEVPHGEIRSYYSLIDVFVVPRTMDEVCRIVTPLKPLEAMALEIPLVISGVAPLVELVGDGRRAAIFEPENPDSLAGVLSTLYQNLEPARARAQLARAWVAGGNTWLDVAARTGDAYRAVGG